MVDPLLLEMVAASPPMVTLAPLRLAPLIVTGVPGKPPVGLTPVSVGAVETAPHLVVSILMLP
jgi:hypothetical protein